MSEQVQRRWWERSAVRAWFTGAVLTVVAIWAGGEEFMPELRENAVALVSGLLAALGFTTTTKSVKPQ